MDYTELIHDFVDGTLDSAKEEELFLLLSSNDELRSELKQQIAIKEAIKSDTAAFTPSAQSTMMVFSALGFSAPAAAPVPVPGGSLSRMANIWQKYSQGIIGGLLTSAITITIFLLAFKPWVNNTSAGAGNEYISVNKEFPAAELALNAERIIPVTKSIAADNAPVKERIITKIKYVQVPVYIDNAQNAIIRENQVPPKEEEPEQSVSLLSEADLAAIEPLKLSLYPNAQGREYLPSKIPILAGNYYVSADINKDWGLSIELKGTQDWFTQNSTISPYDNMKFNNSAIALFYRLSDNVWTGIEYRRENFFQSFEGTDSVGKPFRYEQQPNFECFGADLRYIFPDLLWNIRPLAQLTLGTTNAGYIGRFMGGLQYEPYKGFIFIAGAEYSNMRYHHQKSYFNSGKLGLNYGLIFNF